MPKHRIKLNDTFVFSFPKIMPGSVTDQFSIPASVLNHFLENCANCQLKDSFNSNRAAAPSQIPFIDVKAESLYWFEIEFIFSGVKLGGILHKPDFLEGSILRITSTDPNYIEDEENFYLKIRLEGDTVWDFKSNHYKNYLSSVESSGSKWEDAKVDIRLNFRSNPIQKIGLNRLIQQNKDDTTNKKLIEVKEILDKTPNINSVVRNYRPEKPWELKIKNWEYLEGKNINLEGAYLALFKK